MSSNADPVARFAELAEQYLAWAEGPRIELAADLQRGYALLLDLLRAAIDLPHRDTTGAEETRPTHEEWKAVFKGFAWVPVQFYWEAELDVHGPQETLVGDLHDDLADVWRDLMVGVGLHRSGHVDDACWHWQFGFNYHWGEHAANAVRVMTKMEWHRGW